jgi:hypothetical protein
MSVLSLAGVAVRVQALHFTNSEKAALVAFLKTLTDQQFLSDPKFSDPFQVVHSTDAKE